MNYVVFGQERFHNFSQKDIPSVVQKRSPRYVAKDETMEKDATSLAVTAHRAAASAYRG